VFLCGYSVERVEYDYGFDLILFTYNINSEIENGQIYLQLKATDSLRTLADKETIAFSIARLDLELWLFEPMPCILIVYDAQLDIAYWLYLQAYFENWPGFDLSKVGESVTVHLPKTNILDQEARDFQIKHTQPPNAKKLSNSHSSVSSVPLWFVYVSNLFLISPQSENLPNTGMIF
jgi:hypothetical protein